MVSPDGLEVSLLQLAVTYSVQRGIYLSYSQTEIFVHSLYMKMDKTSQVLIFYFISITHLML